MTERVTLTESPAASLTADHIKHLEFIQAVVARLGNGSFLIKGWALTLVAAFFGLSVNKLSWRLAAIALVPVIGFWLLDVYFLRQERLYRKLYDDVRVSSNTVPPFSMDTRSYAAEVKWLRVATSMTMVSLYGTLILLDLVIIAGGLLKV
jgi:hypothetical protein